MEPRGRLILTVVFLLFTFVSLLSFRALSLDEDTNQHVLHYETSSAKKSSFKAPRLNVWAEISKREAAEIYKFLLVQWADLNITSPPETPSDNFIYTIEALRPNKTDAKPYMYDGQHAPSRYAKVVLSHHVEDKARLSYYAVGPLPVSPETRVEPLTFPFTSGKNYLQTPTADFAQFMEFGSALLLNVSDITMELLGAKLDPANPFGPDSLTALGRSQATDDGGHIMWLQLFRPGAGSSARTLLPQGLYCKIDTTGPQDDWFVSTWFYNGILYEDVEHLRAAMKEPSFLKTPPNRDGPWTDTEDFDASPEGREKPPPISIQPYGPRYKLDADEKYVSWFGFEFYFTTAPATGLSIHDVRFNGESVMYELSLQEALAHYAGDDPMAASQLFLDAFFGMGRYAFELVPGYDCPAYADFISTDMHQNGNTETLPNNICLFEFTSESLLSRHSAQYSVSVSRNTFLTLRAVSTVGNYDYTIDYIFYLDGTIEVKVRASGYIYAAFYPNHPDRIENEYGHRIHEALSSSLHDHVISFKADLDVAGTENRFVRLAVEPTTKAYKWEEQEVKQRNTMHVKEYPVDKETGLDWPRNSGEFYMVYSSATNAWGQRKGYRVVSGTGMANTPHLTVLNSTVAGNTARWAERDLWVVRHKDQEPRGADPLNVLDPQEPFIDFAKIANGESLDPDSGEGYDGDLVLYVNVGSHHLPHSGDVPNTLMHTSASSVMFVPHNFADRDPSRATVQGVRLQLKGTTSGGFAGWDPDPHEPADEELKSRGPQDSSASRYRMHEGANYFGAPYTEALTLPLSALEPDLRRKYKSQEIRVTDLSTNGSAAGMWMKKPQ